jgi:hypothetical protein
MMVSPGYAYDKAPDQQSFLGRRKTNDLFGMILSNRKKRWKFNMSPLFLEFLMGKRDFECTPWGSPAYNIFGWQKPCYLLQEGYYDTFRELIEDTAWDRYGVKSGNPKCQNCMVHCGYEPSAVDYTFAGVSGIWANVKAILSPLYPDEAAARRLAEEAKKPHRPIERLVQLGVAKDVMEKTAA